MKLKPHFPEFLEVRNQIGAQLSKWSLNSTERKPPEPVEFILSSEELKKVKPLDGSGPLQLNGQQILVYIKDTGLDRHTVMFEPEKSRRFHIADCRTLISMLETKRHNRYVATNRIDGKFLVDATKNSFSNEVTKNIKATLYVCKNCLDTLDLRNERKDWPEFPIEEFFRDHETFFPFNPEYTDITAPAGGYPKKWNRISKSAKIKKNYTCEECGVNCSESPETKRLIHCHHIDGIKAHNKPENLRVLCATCHSEQPGHGRFPPSARDKAALDDLRSAQKK